MASPWVDITRSPDGKRQMCCICFEFIPVEELYVDADGLKWDICKPCQKREDEYSESGVVV